MTSNLENLYFELTAACNLLCKHCYVFTSNKPRQRKDLLTREIIYTAVSDAKLLGLTQVTITGGEIFLRKDLREIVEDINRLEIGLNLLTNLTMVGNKEINWLSKLKINLLSTSLDGLAVDHDSFRQKKGAFSKTLKALLSLNDLGVNVKASVTVHKENIESARQLFSYLDDLEIESSIAKVAPIGRGQMIHSSGDLDFNERYTDLLASRLERQLKNYNANLIAPPVITPQTYCGVGETMLYVMADGVVGLCPTLNAMQGNKWVMGNLITSNIESAWNNTRNHFAELRCRNSHSCSFGGVCRGGCRANAYANTGDAEECDSEMLNGFRRWVIGAQARNQVSYRLV